MKVLKSHRDLEFSKWNDYDFGRLGHLSTIARFEYVSIKNMQRGDTTRDSQLWLKKNAKQNTELLNSLRKSIPKDGMISPLILVSTSHPHWKNYVGKTFWSHIPYVIQTGNNRYKVEVENGYTHLSSVILAASVVPEVFNYLQKELKKPLNETIRVDKEFFRDSIGVELCSLI